MPMGITELPRGCVHFKLQPFGPRHTLLYFTFSNLGLRLCKPYIFFISDCPLLNSALRGLKRESGGLEEEKGPHPLPSLTVPISTFQQCTLTVAAPGSSNYFQYLCVFPPSAPKISVVASSYGYQNPADDTPSSVV